jgi:glucose-6-phosphate isomerase
MDIQTDISGLAPFIGNDEISALDKASAAAFRMLMDGKGKGSDFLGWLSLPSRTESDLKTRVKNAAMRLAGLSEVCVVAGIGGSYLGARAVIESLKHSFSALQPGRKFPEIVYAGHQLSSDYFSDLIDLLDQKDYSLIIISKSGTTTEPALAFRVLKAHLEKKYGKAAARDRIVAITDRERGVLKQLADKEAYEQFVVPDDVGGRYSVLTPVGLLPVAVAGYDIHALLDGAAKMEAHLTAEPGQDKNIALHYAVARNACYRKGYLTEIMVNYEPRLYYLAEWWKQLYGESEGKDGKGIFPASVSFTTDLHSLGQYIQDGERKLFETVLRVSEPARVLQVPSEPGDADGLNFMAGKGLTEINKMAEMGTFLAHHDGGVPIFRIRIPRISEYMVGQLIYFFEFACAVSGYMLGVNPFDQPGVEAYKKNMFALLGKPGYESQSAEIKKRLAKKE